MNGIEGGVELVAMSELISPHHNLLIQSPLINLLVAMSNRRQKSIEVDKWLKTEQSKTHLCACGCGQEIIIRKDHCWKGIPKFIKHHNRKGTVKNRLLEEYDWMFQKYVKEELSGYKIGKELDCAHSTVRRHLSALGISIRENNDTKIGREFTKEHKEKIGKANKGENSPNWKGGISFEPYCLEFNKGLKEEIREKFGRVCFLCPKTEEENCQKLSVHHIDYNKKQGCNGIRWLLVPLCRACNSKVNFNRDYWQDLVITKLKQGWYLN